MTNTTFEFYVEGGSLHQLQGEISAECLSLFGPSTYSIRSCDIIPQHTRTAAGEISFRRYEARVVAIGGAS
jgi:hypothetical protein